MRRRDLITLFGGTAIVRPSLVGAQQPGKIPTIGWLVFEAEEGGFDGFRQGLREFGYVEGQNIAIEARSPERSGDRLAEQIAELARLKVKIILTGGVPATLAAKRAALPIPVVFIMADPVGSGIVASLAHPGGNMTGQSLAIEEQFGGKWLELLKDAAPRLSRVAYLWNPANHSSASSWKATQGLAPTLGLTLQSVELRDSKDIGESLDAIIRDRAEGVIVDSDPVTGSNKTRIVKFAAANRLPAMYLWRWTVAEIDPERAALGDQSQRFWTEFLENYLNLDDPEQPKPKPARLGFISFPLPARGSWLTVYRGLRPARVGVFLSCRQNTPGAYAMQAILDEWKAGGAVKDQLGETAKLSRATLGTQDTIIASLQVESLEQPEVRKKAFSWLAERVNTFVNVLRPRMRSAAADYQSRGE